MALLQNPITAIHRVPKRKNTQLIILLIDLRYKDTFLAKKKKKKRKKNPNFYVSELRLVTLIMLYLKPWRVLFGDLAPSVSVCIINKLMPFPTFTWAIGGGGTWVLLLLDSPEGKNFNKIMTLFALAWTHGLHHGKVIIWSIQSASLYGREYHNKAQEKDKENKTARLEFPRHECSILYVYLLLIEKMGCEVGL